MTVITTKRLIGETRAEQIDRINSAVARANSKIETTKDLLWRPWPVASSVDNIPFGYDDEGNSVSGNY